MIESLMHEDGKDDQFLQSSQARDHFLLGRLARVFRLLAHPQLERRALLFRVLLCHVLGAGCQPALLDPPGGRTG